MIKDSNYYKYYDYYYIWLWEKLAEKQFHSKEREIKKESYFNSKLKRHSWIFKTLLLWLCSLDFENDKLIIEYRCYDNKLNYKKNAIALRHFSI